MVFMKLIQDFKKRFYFKVADYFKSLANFALKRWNPRIIAVTGSAGKTTMLHLLEHEMGKVAHYSHDANSAFGVPFDILGLRGIYGSKLRWIYLLLAAPVRAVFMRRKEKFYVVEIDGERPHEAESLATWLKPEVTIWTSIGLSHAVKFEKSVENGDFDTLQDAITSEFANLPKNTTKLVYIDGASAQMKKATANISAKVISFKKTDMKKYVVYPDSTDFTYGETTFHFNHPEPRDLAYHLLVVEDLMKRLKLPFNPDFSNLVTPPGRSNFLRGKKGINIIDSSYNAHIISMEATLDMFARMHADHKWLVIGDIIDQGSLEETEHKKLAHLIAEVKPEKVILVGRRTKSWTAPELKSLGISALTTTDPKKALEYLEKRLTGRETVLFKGSQYLEWIIENLLADPADARLLCRRDKAARKRRKSWGLN